VLSHEHTGFKFVQGLETAASEVILHSGGKNSDALRRLAEAEKKSHEMQPEHAGDYRAFILAEHPVHGILLLQATKKNKGTHFQLPGGHVDAEEVQRVGVEKAFVTAAARELFEETQIDLREKLERLTPIDVGLCLLFTN
jgi:8-oxo-dGTP pyrophosphatase MutT (NUDIX family)